MKAYPLEFRKRVINHLKRGATIKETTELFEIGRDTVFRWKRLDAEGRLSPKESWGKWKKIDPAKLEASVSLKRDSTLEQRAEELGVSKSGIWRALVRLKITRKKNKRGIAKETITSGGFSKR